MNQEARRQAILDHLARYGPSSANIISHDVWRDWKGPPGNGSHPLIRVTGRMLHALKRRGLVREEFDVDDKRFVWKLCLVATLKGEKR